MSNKEDVYALPIDQYSRQFWAREVIQLLNSKKKQKILDLGGYKGKTKLFHPNDDVFIADLFDVDEENYTKLDGSAKLPFEDNSFDFVCSFDVFEHVPRENRKLFIQEAVRVSKNGLILAAPFDNEYGAVSAAEKALNEHHKKLYDKDHPWLLEHIENVIPKRSEMEKLLNSLNVEFTNFGVNSLSTWQIMQTIYFSIMLDEEIRGRVDEVNRIYSKDLSQVDMVFAGDTSYRTIYFISQDVTMMKKVDTFIAEKQKTTDPSRKFTFEAAALGMFGIKYRDISLHDAYLESEVVRLKEEVTSKDKKIEKIENFIKNHKVVGRVVRRKLHK